MTLMNLSARKTAKAGVAPRLLAYLQAAAAAEPKEDGWKALEYQLLVGRIAPRNWKRPCGGGSTPATRAMLGVPAWPASWPNRDALRMPSRC